ncbi:major facilitator superfamily domain-containing protein [Dactylonectria macrodidyma]|uniref:Major facilitator superfamily domain-containing protein n=1 Tax=Dactylonectria macrodidyma TaxID=307937 RepID=A0A9P9JKK1_9HYPO|nr:major facilitator superfamily domain-containing protein [Dactylonectria macrodidyma]
MVNDSTKPSDHHDETRPTSLSLRREPTREEKTREAIDEGHDADIPSNIGFILTEAEERKRRTSIVSSRRARRNSSVAGDHDKVRGEPENKRSRENHNAESLVAGEKKEDDEDDGQEEEDDDDGDVTLSNESDIVWWDSDSDPENPYNWARWRKVLNCVLVSALTFVTPLASSMFAPGVPELMIEFESRSTELASFCVSVYVLGFAAGPMIFAPLSELYGRLIVYHGCNVGFIVFLIACAKAPTLSSLIAFRFLSGVFGSAPITNGGGTIADMIVQEKRGAAMASFAIGPLLGPIVGPVVGGIVTDALGWRWVFWILAILSGGLSAIFLVFSGESYAPVILKRKTARLQKETGNPRLRSKLDAGLSPADYFKRGILRPFKMLIFSPVCIICGLYVGLAYAYLYLMFTSLTPLFMRIYGFSTINSGLTFLGLGVGSMIGVIYFSLSSDRQVKKMAAHDKERAAEVSNIDGGEAGVAQGDGPALAVNGMKPEYRLPPLKIGAFLLPAGLFIYGWTAEYEVHWIAPIIGTAVMGVGNLIIFMSLQMYLVDSFTVYAASALAANAVMRSIAGAVLPLAGLPMFDKLGMGWGNSLLGFIAAALLPAPWLFMKYGEYLRTRFEIKDL